MKFFKIKPSPVKMLRKRHPSSQKFKIFYKYKTVSTNFGVKAIFFSQIYQAFLVSSVPASDKF
jgi:hypothetical protein